jgi:hypothetical protein
MAYNKELAEWARKQRISRGRGLTDEKRAALDAIGFCWDNKEAEWEQNFQHLKEYKEQYGTLDNLSETTHKRLNNWCTYQRRQNRLGRLTDEQRAKLDSIDFEYECNDQGDNWLWYTSYKELVEYHKQHGHSMVPRYDNDGNEIPLARWIIHQRESYKDSRMPDNRKRLLESLGIFREIKVTPIENSISKIAAAAPAGHSQNPTPQVVATAASTQDLEEDDLEHEGHQGTAPTVAATVAPSSPDDTTMAPTALTPAHLHRPRQRQDRTLQPKEEDLNEAEWEESFQRLKKYKEQHGTLYMSSNTHKHLISWCKHQRLQSKRGRMTDKQRAKLNSIGFVWQYCSQRIAKTVAAARAKEVELNEAWWEESFQHLKKYKEQHGTLSMPSDTHKHLQCWCDCQCQQNKLGRLTDKQRAKLESIGFTWQEDYSQNIISQADRQRQQDKLGSMVDKQRAKLESLGFMWNEDCSQNIISQADCQRQQDKLGRMADKQRAKLVWREDYSKNITATLENLVAEAVAAARLEEAEFNKKRRMEDQPRDATVFKKPRKIELNMKCRSEGQPKDITGVEEPRSVSAQQQETFNEMHSLLQEFQMKHGHCHVPAVGMYADHKLYNWLYQIRSLHAVSCCVLLSCWSELKTNLPHTFFAVWSA